MSDLISRQDAIDAFGLSEKTRKYGGDHSGYNTMMLYEIQDILEGLPSAEPKTGEWIPCSERLPEDVDVGEEFPIVIFCTSTTTYIGFYEYNRGRWWDSAYEEVVSDVIAWQPLPEPYSDSCLSSAACRRRPSHHCLP